MYIQYIYTCIFTQPYRQPCNGRTLKDHLILSKIGTSEFLTIVLGENFCRHSADMPNEMQAM